MPFDPEKITFFAKTDARGQNIPFGIKAKDRTKHMYIIGKTGMGKSTLLENMAIQDIKNGEGLAFIDPHGQTAETLLDYVPEERKDDVLYFAPFDIEYPLAFNVMEDVGPERRHLVVSGLMSVFKKIWVDVWSARMEYILQNTLLALLEYPESTLLGVNRMLSDKKYRRQVIDNIADPAVKSFWVDEFLNYNERYMQEAGDSIKNKIGQFTANPIIRNIIGQPKSSFDIRKIMDEKKIIIMNLSKGLVGESNANLLGSMLTTRIYLAAMSRADMPLEEMKKAPNFYFYVDEFQSFANATFADILSEARKYKLNLTIAHQYIEQMEEEVRNAVFGNVGTIVSFRVGPFDAEILETMFAPQFTATDIVNLGFTQIYLSLMIDGIGSQPFSAVTLPPIEKENKSCKQMIIASSRNQFAKPRKEVDAAIISWHEIPGADDGKERTGNHQANKNSSEGNNRGGAPERRTTPSSNGGQNRGSSSERRTTSSGNESNNRGSSPDRRTTTSPSRGGQATDAHKDKDINQKSLPKSRLNSERTEAKPGNGSLKTENKSEREKLEKKPEKKSEKKLEDLRSVLERLSKDSVGDKEKNETPAIKPTPEEITQKRISSSSESKTSKANTSGGDLKSTLAGVVNNVAKSSPPSAEKTRDNVDRTPVDDVADQAREIEQLERELEAKESNFTPADDPLNPKKIERMMKVPPGTRSPF